MSLSNSLRAFFIDLTGYFIYKKAHLPIGVDFKEANSQLNSLKTSNNNKTEEAIKENIKVVTLNDFSRAEKITKIDLLKIDTEGFELEVLKGSANILKNKQIRSILCEVALTHRNNRNKLLNDIISFLESNNYFFVGLFDTNKNYHKKYLAYSNALIY